MKLIQSQPLSRTERIYVGGVIRLGGKEVNQRWVIKLNQKKNTIEVYSLTQTEYQTDRETLVCYEGKPINKK